MEEMVADAYKLTDPAKHIYGFVANGQKGPAVAQDWMQYNAEMGGSILGPDGKPALNSPANIKSLTVYRDLFQKAAPPGAVNYDWGGREESFRQGVAAKCRPGLSARRATMIRRSRRSSAKSASRPRHAARDCLKVYGIGGWGLAINADVKANRRRPPGPSSSGSQPGDPQGDEHDGRGQFPPQERDGRPGA